MTCALNVPLPADCRGRLIQAATAVFLEEGYRASVDRIAARAGVAKQTVYNQFGSKEALFREVGTLLADSVGVELEQQDGSYEDGLYRFGRDLRAKVLSDAGIAMYRAFHVEAARVPEMVLAIHQRVVTRLAEICACYLQKGMAEGRLRQDDAHFAAEMLMSMLVYMDRAMRLAGKPQLSPEAEEARLRKIVDCFLRAFAP